MRKRRYLIGALVLSIAIIGVTEALAATRTLDQEIVGGVKPKRLPKVKRKSIALHVRTASEDALNPSLVPSTANHAYIDFDNDGKIYPRSVPTCPLSSIDGKSTEEARAICNSSLVGKGSAAIRFGTPGLPPPPGGDVAVTVSAFNGEPSNGVPTMILHSDPGFTPVDLVGRLVRSPLGRDYGTRLDVVVPTTGGSLTFFDTTIHRAGYVKSRCHDRNHKLNVHGKFSFNDSAGVYPTTAEAFDFQRCKVLRRKHRR
jgi:hypothetical protein